MNTNERTTAGCPRADARYHPRATSQLAAWLTVAGLVGIGASSAAGQFTITGPPTLPDAYVGEYYSQEITAADGILPYTATISFGALPQGLTVNGTGNGAGRRHLEPVSKPPLSHRMGIEWERRAVGTDSCFRAIGYVRHQLTTAQTTGQESQPQTPT